MDDIARVAAGRLAFDRVGGTFVGTARPPDRDCILFMGIAFGRSVSVPVTGREELGVGQDARKLETLLAQRLLQAQKLIDEVTRETNQTVARNGRRRNAGRQPSRRRRGAQPAGGAGDRADGSVDGVSCEDRERLLGR